MKLKKVKVKTVGQLKKILDGVFSEYIRRLEKGVCFICGNVKNWREQQNGHYESRRFNATRYFEKNNHCSCVACNIFKKGNLTVYAIRLQRKYGRGILEELNKMTKQMKQFSRPELENLIEVYKGKIKELES